jgi:hypothetical protein
MYKLNEILAAFKAGFTSSGQNSQLLIPENLKLLPVLILGLLKNVSFYFVIKKMVHCTRVDLLGCPDCFQTIPACPKRSSCLRHEPDVRLSSGDVHR